jgi:hypothetical protein
VEGHAPDESQERKRKTIRAIGDHSPLLARSLRRRSEDVEGGFAGLVTDLEDLGHPEDPVEPVRDD